MRTACIEEMGSAYKSLVGKHGTNKSLGKPEHEWKDAINIDIK
jgi:hypothetical protein